MPIHAVRIAALWILLGLVPLGSAASFDCAKARTPSEKLICSTPELSAADDRAASAYKTALAKAADDSPIPRKDLKSDQVAWLHLILANCRDVETMRAAYADRIATLEFLLKPASAVKSKFQLVEYSFDSSRKFPQIRSTGINAGAELFNYLVRQNVDGAPISGSYLSHDTEIVEGRVASTYLVMERSNPSAPHGWPLRNSITVDLAKGQAVTIESLFRPGADFQSRLTRIAHEQLIADGNEESMVAEGTKRLDYFTLRKGMLVWVFPPYAVAPFSAGDPKVEIPFSKLADLAAPGGLLTVLK